MVGPVAGYTPIYNFAKVRYDVSGWSTLEHGNWTLLDALLSLVTGLPGVKGVWANSTPYFVGDRTVDAEEGGVYRCLVSHTSAATDTFAADRAANPTYWEVLITTPLFIGSWATSTAYSIADIVKFNTYDYYYCVEAHTSGVFATDLAAGKWTLIWEGSATVDAAEAAQVAAETARTGAETAETNAETAETNAETAATTATTQAGIATTQAGIATTQAGIATTQASNASASAVAADASADAAALSESAAASSAANAATSYDNFDDRYLGAKASPPTLDNDGNALIVGALYFRTTATVGMYVWDGTAWGQVGPATGTLSLINGSAASPSLTFSSDPNTGIYSSAADAIGFSTGGSIRFQMLSANAQCLVPLQGADGSASLPAFTFVNDPDTGMYRGGANTVGFATSGVIRFQLTATVAQCLVNFEAADGLVGTPGITFVNDPDTGIYRPTANTLAFSTSGSLRLSIGPASAGFFVGLGIQGSGATSATDALGITNSATNSLFRVRDDGYVMCPITYALTTAAAANVYINTDGGLFRSTSSRRYKSDVKGYTRGLEALELLRPVTFVQKGAGSTRFAGFIAEEVHDAGLTEFVVYDSENKPDALHYSNMVALLTAALKEANAKIEALTARVAALET